MAEETVKTYWAKFGVDASEFVNGISQAQGGFLSFYRDLTVSLNMTAQIINQVLGVAQELKKLADTAMETQSTIDKLGVTTGMTSQELYKWSNVARYADSDIGSLSAMLRKLSLNMNESGESGDKARAMLTAMHVSIKNADGSVRSMSDIFPDIIDGLKGIDDAGQRNVVAMTLFGRSYQELSGYLLLTKEELKTHFDEGWAPTEAQSQKLRDYEEALKDINTASKNITNQGGIALSESMSELAIAMNDAVSDGAPLLEFLGYVNEALLLTVQTLDEAITGYRVIEAYLKGNFKDARAITAAHDERELARKERREERELMEWVAANPELKGTTGILDPFGLLSGETGGAGASFQMPVSSKSTKEAPKLYEIASWQNELEKTQKVDIPNQQIKINNLEKEYRALGDKSTEAAKAKNRELIEANLHMKDLNIKIDEYNAKLKEAGSPTTQTAGATAGSVLGVGTQFASATDYAGEFDLSKMTAEQLQAVIDKAGKGGSKSQADKAQSLLTLMKRGGSTGSTSAAATTTSTTKTAAEPGTPAQTASVKSEYDLQTSALQHVTESVKKEYDKQTQYFIDYMNQIAAIRTTQYPVLEKQDLIHWATFEEIAKVAEQKVGDFMATEVNWAGENPIIQNLIVRSKDGDDWTPPTYHKVTSPKLESADFTTVGSSVQAIVSKGLGKGTSADIKIEVNQTITGTDKTIADKVADSTLAGVNKGLAGVNYLGGSMI